MLWDNLVFCFFFMALMYGIGTVISRKTKGIMIALVFVCVVYITGYLTGLIPTTTPKNLGLSPLVSGFLTILIVVHLGSTISIRQLLAQWRTVICCVVALIIMVMIMLTLGASVFGFQTAVAAAGPISGGFVSTLLAANAVEAAGLTHLSPLVWMVGILQQLIGIPITSILLRTHVKNLIRNGEHLTKPRVAQIEDDANFKSKFKIFPNIPEQYNSPYLILAKVALIAFISSFVDKMTNSAVPAAVVALILSVICCELGFLDKNALNKACMMSFVMFIVQANTPASFASLTVESILPVLGATLGLLAFGISGIIIGALLIGKILKMPLILAVCCGLTALFGFPSTMLITEEVVRAAGLPQDQSQNLTDRTMPYMLVSGFATVTVASVLITGIIVSYAF